MKAKNFNSLLKSISGNSKTIELHSPFFSGNEKKYVNQTIESTFVSTVGKFVDKFENDISALTKSKYSIATVNFSKCSTK